MTSAHGTSDPVTYECTCSCKNSATDKGTTLLFYRYYANIPSYTPKSTETRQDLAEWHTVRSEKYHLAGKIRIAHEGFNITVAGTTHEIEKYIDECVPHWSFTNLELAGDDKGKAKRAFFKPSPGCACVFLGRLKIDVKDEITPMGITNYSPKNWDIIDSLEPVEWHCRCLQQDANVILVDVRNYYESRIGFFRVPSSSSSNREGTLKPQVRRFSQWPKFVRERIVPLAGDKEDEDKKSKDMQYLTYCTGGIRCEKGARYLAESLPSGRRIATLKGGIAGYMAWIDEEIAAGRMSPEDSLFKGRNYVFDARGSIGLGNGDLEVVSKCHGCGRRDGRLGKCVEDGCHLVLVVCEDCEKRKGGVRCCGSCGDIEEEGLKVERKSRPICECERERENRLWGGNFK